MDISREQPSGLVVCDELVLGPLDHGRSEQLAVVRQRGEQVALLLVCHSELVLVRLALLVQGVFLVS